VIDILIFILFTHPVMQLLARTRFFGGGTRCRASTPRRSARLRGRAQFRPPVVDGAKGSAARRAGARAARRNAVRRSPDASRPELAAGSRKATEGRLMRSMNEFGNDLYTGKTSFPFVGRRRCGSSSPQPS
jgi:preprotein translocase subunit SecD